MITIRKLRTLKQATLRRKTAVMLQAFEQQLAEGQPPDAVYYQQFLEIVEDVFSSSERVRAKAAGAADCSLRAVNSLRHAILQELGSEPADWDMYPEECSSGAGRAAGTEGSRPSRTAVSSHSDLKIFLDDIRSPFNIGSIFRTAEAFGVEKIFLSPDCPSPEHPRAARSSMGCTGIVPWEYIDKNEVFKAGSVFQPLFALELGGAQLSDFSFPQKGTAVIGSEELGISPEARAAVSAGLGLVSIPIYGAKGSINVSSAFAIMMQRWAESVL